INTDMNLTALDQDITQLNHHFSKKYYLCCKKRNLGRDLITTIEAQIASLTDIVGIANICKEVALMKSLKLNEPQTVLFDHLKNKLLMQKSTMKYETALKECRKSNKVKDRKMIEMLGENVNCYLD